MTTGTSTLVRLPLGQLTALRMLVERDAVGLTTRAAEVPGDGEVSERTGRALARRRFARFTDGPNGAGYQPTADGIDHVRAVAQGNALPPWAKGS